MILKYGGILRGLKRRNKVLSNYLELLAHIDPTILEYQEWLAVGMALHHEGAPADVWDTWSQRDAKRYKDGVCQRKWAGFNGEGVTAGTLHALASKQGWTPPKIDHRAFEWDEMIDKPWEGGEDNRVIDPGWVEDVEVTEPTEWSPKAQITTYLNTLFESSDYVGYVTESWLSEDGKHSPKKGHYDRTAGELLQELAALSDDDIGKVFGDYNEPAGAWIRPNPLDGKGVGNANVKAFRYVLVESDDIPVERQAAIYIELELPVAILIHSGGKSLHAIVKIDAIDEAEYRKRVDFLFKVLVENGIEKKARQNKNPNRLSRMPGIIRNGQKQYIAALDSGKASWAEWKDWIEEQNDDLPDIECLADVWDNMPPLASPLIDGILREGHKLLLAGPSKAGKSFILLQLAIAIAEGTPWLGWTCSPGRVLYVNLELDRPSLLDRLKMLYNALGLPPKNITMIDCWHMRGRAVPMDILAPKLIWRAVKKRYQAIIIDPIYKVITGDENAADKMAHFCNQFDRLCHELGSAVIYCHHHSKGQQGQKSSIDRSSGSGVFSRDPDAIIDLIELNLTADMRKSIKNRHICNMVTAWLDTHHEDWSDKISQDEMIVADTLVATAREEYGFPSLVLEQAQIAAANISGWRIEGTLREFPPFDPRRFFFQYPIHVHDRDNLLIDAKAEGEEFPWVAGSRDKKPGERKQSSREKLKNFYHMVADFAPGEEKVVSVGDISDAAGVEVGTVKRWIKETSDYALKDDLVYTKEARRKMRFEDAVSNAKDLHGTVKIDDVAKLLNNMSKRTVQRYVKEYGYESNEGIITEKNDE